jgi:hypothetical protein
MAETEKLVNGVCGNRQTQSDRGGIESNYLVPSLRKFASQLLKFGSSPPLNDLTPFLRGQQDKLAQSCFRRINLRWNWDADFDPHRPLT